MYALIVLELKDSELSDNGYEVFGDDEAIYAVGERGYLEELVSSWTPKKSNGDTLYKTDKGFYVGLPYNHIIRVGSDE